MVKIVRLLHRAALLTLCLCMLASFRPSPARAQTPTPLPPFEPPFGFYLIDAANGVQLYKKDYPNGNPDYVQLVNLRQGAQIRLMHGQITEPRPAKGAYGGADPRLTSLPLQTYWSEASGLDPHAFCVTNGLFFYMPEYPTRLAFPLKVDGRLVSDGWGDQTYPGQKMLLELWDDRAAITELSSQQLHGSSAPDIIGGLTEDANKRIKASVGRTFVGIADLDGDSLDETVLLFNSFSSLQSGAAEVLRSFGANQVMMLDGGGSTQLLCQGGWYIRSERPIPQALAVIAAPAPPIAGQLRTHSSWPVIVAGSSLPIEFSVQNTGVLTWTQAEVGFYLNANRLELEQRFNASQPVASGSVVTITRSLAGFNQTGVIQVPVNWGLVYQGEDYPGQSFRLDLIVLPIWLEDRKTELQALVQQWRLEQPDQVSRLVGEWLNRQNRLQMDFLGLKGLFRVHPFDAGLVVLIMLPFLAGLALVIARIQR
jgi:hypothetical protein